MKKIRLYQVTGICADVEKQELSITSNGRKSFDIYNCGQEKIYELANYLSEQFGFAMSSKPILKERYKQFRG